MITRRSFLKTSGAVAGAGLLPLRAFAVEEERTRPRTLVVLFLRGGVDGLNLVVPHGENAYYELRSYVAIRRPGEENGALDLDGTFGLHPSAAPLLPLFEDGTGVALHAVGYDKNSRSHFEEQDVWETGIVGATIHSEGWLNRHLATTEGRGPVRAVALADQLPRILRGKSEVLALDTLEDLAFDPGDAMARALDAAYRPHEEDDESRALLARSAQSALVSLRELAAVVKEPYRSKVEYPDTGLGRRLRSLARLIKADVGLEVASVDYGGWDTHRNQPGPYANKVRELSGAVSAFARDLDGRLDDVLVLTLSEFGRTAFQNGTGGTDHGWGNCLLAFGGPVLRAGDGKARKVAGTWPGLEREQLHQERDLAQTTDFRDVIAEVLVRQLATADLAAVLPGHDARPVGLIA